MELFDVCPRCLSHHQNIRGVIYPSGNVNDGYRCDHEWHMGGDYNVNELKLTADDCTWLEAMHIATA